VGHVTGVVALLLVSIAVIASVTDEAQGGTVSDKAERLPDLAGLLKTHGEGQRVEPVVLGNGLVVLLKELHSAPVVTAQVYVQTGSMNEGELSGSGVSHVLEHLVHGGQTPARTEEETSDLLDSIGGQTNAATWLDTTRYYISTGRDYLPLALELLSDWMSNVEISEAAFQREMKVINEELRRGQDSAQRELWQSTMDNLFRVHPARLPVIGYPELLNSLTREQVIRYYHHRYVPNNMVLVIVGDIETDEAMKHVEETFGKLTRGFIEPMALPQEPKQVARRSVTKEFRPLGESGTALLRMDVHTVPLTSPDLYPLDVLAYILSHGRSSRLVDTLREERRLVLGISAFSYTPGFDAGFFGIQATCTPEKLPEVKQAVWDEISRLREDLVTPEELAKAKRQKITDYFYGLETVESQAGGLVSGYLAAGDPNFDLTYAQGIQRVTAEDIRRVVRAYFGEQDLCVTALVPPPPAEAPAEERPAAVQSQAARPFVRKTTFPNGLVLLLKEDHTLPLVTVQAAALGGLRVETEDTNGLFTFTTSMLTRGTEKRSARDIARFLDERGASLSAGTGKNTVYVAGRCISADFDQFYELLVEVLTQASFPEEEMERVRPMLLSAVARRNEQGEREALLFFNQVMYPDSPLSFFRGGREEVVSRLTREDLLRCYRQYVRPERMVLSVFGDVDAEEVTAQVRRTLGSFTLDEPLGEIPAPRPNPPRVEELKAAKKTDKKKAYVVVGYPSMDLTDATARPPFEVLDAVMSGIRLPGGWLHEALRGPNSEGLVYGVHAFNDIGLDVGSFIIFADCEPGQTDRVIDIMLKQVERARSGKPVGSQELERARRTVITAQELQHQSLSDQALDAALNELYGLGYDYSEKFLEQVRSVSAEQLQEVARRYLKEPVVAVCTPATVGETAEPEEGANK